MMCLASSKPVSPEALSVRLAHPVPPQLFPLTACNQDPHPRQIDLTNFHLDLMDNAADSVARHADIINCAVIEKYTTPSGSVLNWTRHAFLALVFHRTHCLQAGLLRLHPENMHDKFNFSQTRALQNAGAEFTWTLLSCSWSVCRSARRSLGYDVHRVFKSEGDKRCKNYPVVQVLLYFEGLETSSNMSKKCNSCKKFELGPPRCNNKTMSFFCRVFFHIQGRSTLTLFVFQIWICCQCGGLFTGFCLIDTTTGITFLQTVSRTCRNLSWGGTVFSFFQVIFPLLQPLLFLLLRLLHLQSKVTLQDKSKTPDCVGKSFVWATVESLGFLSPGDSLQAAFALEQQTCFSKVQKLKTQQATLQAKLFLLHL